MNDGPNFLQTPLMLAACQSARVGADTAMNFFGPSAHNKLEVEQKDESYNLVTIADLKTEQSIIESLKLTYPDHHFLGEESSSDSIESENLWIIDPIDGTNNFLHGLPWFGISIAYYQDGNPVCGVVLNPATNDWYVCFHKQGAWHFKGHSPIDQNRETITLHRCRVSEAETFAESLIGVGFYYDRDAKMRAMLRAIEKVFEQNVRGIRRLGAASLDLCMVGCGQFAGYFEYQLSPWDFAAGRLFVEEAGGKITSCDGEPIGLSKTSILASNELIHEKILEIVKHQLSSCS